MGFTTRIKHGLHLTVPPMLFLALVGYFGWSATQGERGLQSYVLRQAQLVTAQIELRRTEHERDLMERRVAALRGVRLDPDMVDERARALLGQTDATDVVVLWPKDRWLFLTPVN